MAHTYAILRQDTTDVVLNLDSYDPADISLATAPQVNNSNQLVSTYSVDTAGDYRYPTTITARVSNARNGGSRTLSVSLASWVTDTNADAEVVEIKPATITVSIVIPSTFVEIADLLTMLMNSYSLLLGTITTSEPDGAPLASMMQGAIGELW